MSLFQNYKVIELASVLAGPSVGQFFAELGANVIKIENPKTEGDVTRSWKLKSENNESSISAYFSSANWGKESISLNIYIDNDLQQLYTLIKEADIVIASYKPGDAEKLKVDYKTLSNINPQLIYGSITGYSSKSKVGYDAIIQAESGFMYMNGQKDSPPTKMPVALMDVLTAHQLKEGILVALLNKTQTGQGDLVEVSLFDTAISSLANQATNYLMGNKIPERIGSEHPNIVPYGTVFYDKNNLPLVLAVGSDKQFKKLCEILKISEISENENYSTNQQRVINRENALSILSIEIKKTERTDLLNDLEKNNVPAGAVNTVQESLSTEDSQRLILSNDDSKGVKNIAFRVGNMELNNGIIPPPEFDK